LAQLHVNLMATMMTMWGSHETRFTTLPVIVRILYFNIKGPNTYCIFPYTQQPLLLASLKPMRLLFLNPKQQNISNPYIMYVACVFVSKCNICKLVPTPEIYLENYGTLKKYVRRLNSRYYEHERKQNVQKQPSVLLAIHPSHLFKEC